MINQLKSSNERLDSMDARNILAYEKEKEIEMGLVSAPSNETEDDCKRKASSIMTLHDVPLSPAFSVDHKFQ